MRYPALRRVELLQKLLKVMASVECKVNSIEILFRLRPKHNCADVAVSNLRFRTKTRRGRNSGDEDPFELDAARRHLDNRYVSWEVTKKGYRKTGR